MRETARIDLILAMGPRLGQQGAWRPRMNVNVVAEGSNKEEIAGTPFEIERLGPLLGAEIRGLDLEQAMAAGRTKPSSRR